MFKIEKHKGKFSVGLYNRYNKQLYNVTGFSSKQAVIKNIRATMESVNSKQVLVQDNSILEPHVLRVTKSGLFVTNKKLWK